MVRCPECWQDITDEQMTGDSDVSGHIDMFYYCERCKIAVYTYKVERWEFDEDD